MCFGCFLCYRKSCVEQRLPEVTYDKEAWFQIRADLLLIAEMSLHQKKYWCAVLNHCAFLHNICSQELRIAQIESIFLQK